MKLLHIVASPRGEKSTSVQVADAFLEGLQERGDVEVEVIDLYNQELPAVAGDNIEVKYTLMVGQPIDRAHLESWRQIEALIQHFLSADAYLISVPMWNLGIPYALKYYIDCIVQPGYAFRYDDVGQLVPLVLGKKMLCITSRGGDYSPGGHLNAFDFQEPYLRAIFGLIGITDLTFITAEGMDMPPTRPGNLAAALEAARTLAAGDSWLPPLAASV
ncbi:FMN-dependent NADH-azoreductase [Jatrophihabitans sp. GAS493]|uniref:FMN-dependent NADH-azoreductase n=1 Tax=Jatrophihabitans sp. GAS493 TaxID=1907575 RepID=UPI000BB692A2|nr:NAD(P)H-dependent oxidoreductase [Jatrophihabitans sp. GAS493]SOD74790.1 FMN-dependent NADH-azoreductase [Jatrophihabitans sp. GAS493]